MQEFYKKTLEERIAAAVKQKTMRSQSVTEKWTRDTNVLAINFTVAHSLDEIYNKQLSSASGVDLAWYDATRGEIVCKSSLIKPDPYRTGGSVALSLAPNAMLDAPSFETVYEDLILPYIRRSDLLIAHNAPLHTRILLNALVFYRVTAPDIMCACTLDMAKKQLHIEENSLDAIYKACEIDRRAGESDSDAFLCLKLFQEFTDKGFHYSGRSIEKMSQGKS